MSNENLDWNEIFSPQKSDSRAGVIIAAIADYVYSLCYSSARDYFITESLKRKQFPNAPVTISGQWSTVHDEGE